MSSFALPLLASFVGAAFAAFVPKVFAARTRIPSLLGFVKLTYLRTAAGAVFGLTAATGIGLSTSNHSHENVSYVIWYALAGATLVAAIVLTMIIDRRSERIEDGGQSPMNRLLRRQWQEIKGTRPPSYESREHVRTARAPAPQMPPASPAPAQARAVSLQQASDERADAAEGHAANLKVRRAAASHIQDQSLISDLVAEIQDGRKLLAPIDCPEYTMTAATGWSISSGQTETKIRVWAKRVRNRLTSRPEAVAVFDRGPDLPAPSVVGAIAGLRGTVSREVLVAFLAAKLRNLERITKELDAAQGEN